MVRVMNREHLARWRGLKDLLCDAVTHGASAVERVHLETARRPFVVLEHLPPIAASAHQIHQVHDALVSFSYGNVRAVTGGVRRVLDIALEAMDREHPPPKRGG